MAGAETKETARWFLQASCFMFTATRVPRGQSGIRSAVPSDSSTRKKNQEATIGIGDGKENRLETNRFPLATLNTPFTPLRHSHSPSAHHSISVPFTPLSHIYSQSPHYSISIPLAPLSHTHSLSAYHSFSVSFHHLLPILLPTHRRHRVIYPYSQHIKSWYHKDCMESMRTLWDGTVG